MRLIKPDVELWAQGQDGISHVARCARVCYASSKQDGNEALVERLKENKHLSMFRHQTYYFHLPEDHDVPNGIMYFLQHNIYCSFVVKARKRAALAGQEAFVVMNGQFVLEHERLMAILYKYMVSEADYIKEAFHQRSRHIKLCVLLSVRFTVCVTTQISTSRELNRKSPNNIAEQSTRYVNFGKRGDGICICEPAQWQEWSRWQRMRMKWAWWWSEKMYLSLVRHGMADKNFSHSSCLEPGNARGVLPLDTATKVVYTYSLREWSRIFDLRLRGKTGKPHPNAAWVTGMIREEIIAHTPWLADTDLEI